MTMHRRDFLKTAAAGGALAGLGTLLPRSANAAFTRHKAAKRLKILVLGGTRFLGPHTVKYARARGHEVTLFNRGRSNPDLFQDLERLVGDRDDQLEALEGREWDAVLDTCGYVPRIVKMSADLLRDHVKHYVFISTISVFADFNEIGLNEDSAVGKIDDESIEDVTAESYGPLKALCEQAAEASMPGRVCNIRPGLIVGPLDRSDRFTYWPVRVSQGSEVLAPHSPDEPTQVIDVRDLAEFIVDCIEREVCGLFNTVSPPGEMTMGELLDISKRISGSNATFTWADQDFLAEQSVEAWSDMPCWIPTTMEAGVGTIRVDRALAQGLTFRPITETVRDTLDWWKTLPETRTLNMRSGLTAEREAEVLAAWHER